MNAKLSLAVIAATLAASPVAMAQTTGNTYNNDASRSGYERSSPSGLPTTSPQVRSLPGEQPDPWDSNNSGSQTWNSPGNRGMSGSSGSTVGNSVGSYGSSGNTSGTAGRVVGPAATTGTYGSSGTYGSTGTYSAPGSSGSTGMMGSTGSMGSTGTMGSTGDMQGNRQVLMNVGPAQQQGRADRGQNKTELMQTMLLNNFSAAGFTAVRDFHKQGENYIAEVQDQNGGWSMVELDPRTGTISTIR